MSRERLMQGAERTYEYTIKKFNSDWILREYYIRKYRVCEDVFYADITECNKRIKDFCCSLAKEGCNCKDPACHHFAGAVSAVLDICKIPNKVMVGCALDRDSKSFRRDMQTLNQKGPQAYRGLCNHCWVLLGDGRIVDRFKGTSNREYVWGICVKC